MVKPFGQDPIDIFSSPSLVVTSGGLVKVFGMRQKRHEERTGRITRVIYDARKPLVPGFRNEYDIMIWFDGKGDSTASHYHQERDELLMCIRGRITIVVYDPLAGNTQRIPLSAAQHKVVYVPRNLVHYVIAIAEESLLRVCANAPNSDDDEHLLEIPAHLIPKEEIKPWPDT